MLISKAYAQAVQMSGDAPPPLPEAPSASEAFIWNMGLVAVLVLMFYVLLIRPQQKRIKEHTEMLQGLKKGDKVVTAGGLVGTIAKIRDGEDEVQVDLGNGMMVSVMRNMLQGVNVNKAVMKDGPANDTPGKRAEAGSKKK